MTNASVRFVSSRYPVLASVLLILGASPLLAQVVGPRLMFTDIESGPGTGGQNDLGPFISIHGEGFGATQGSSTVTIGGQPVASVTSWGQDNAPRGLDRIVVQPGPGAVSGNIVVTVGGQASNGLPFTVRAGNIYFVNQASGNDANPGSFAQPWATIWRPRQTMVAGDIVYVIGGTFSQLDPDWPGWDTLLMLDTSFGASGTAAAPIAYLGYPGNPPLFEDVTDVARRGIYLNQDSGPLSYIVIGNMRFGLVREATLVTGLGQRLVGNDLSNGGIGDKIGVFGNTSAIRILGNRLVSNGTPTTKYYSIYVQGFGVNSDVEVGWNEIRNQYGRSMQVFGHIDGDRVEDLRIHDNVMVGADLNNLLLGGSDGNNEILGTVTVTGNIIAGSTGAEGLRVNDPQGTVVIENNTLVGNAFAQVYLERAGAGLITLRDNIVVAQAGQQYYQFDVGSSSASFVPANNLVFGAGPCDPWDTGCINQDPLFAGASDYHLQSGSPAIDAGVATSVSRDHDGIPRPQGAAYDIGAYEREAAAQPSISIGDAALVEGNAGSSNAAFTVTLSTASSGGVTVAFATADGSATAGSDYTATSGTLSFAPGSTSGAVSVPVLGDGVPEADETFQVNLSAPSGATLGDAQGGGLIVNDDAPAVAIPTELAHGTTLRLDLAADPGPTPDVDLFRIRQQPRASYEVVVDATSGDVGNPISPILLDRVAADLTTVLEVSSPIGQGASRSLRWQQPLASVQDFEVVRVRSGSCTLLCDAADVYRLRTFETTAFIPRFNNSATQITVLVVENAAAQGVSGSLWFWGPSGSLLGSQAFTAPGRGTFTLNTATVPGVAGASGSVTLSHDGRYGDLSGKAVSVEPATGFTFDTPMVLRPR